MKETDLTAREAARFSANQPVYVKRNTPEGKVFDNVTWHVEGYRGDKVVVVSHDGRMEKELTPDTLHAWQEEMQDTLAATEETIPRVQLMGEDIPENTETEPQIYSEELRREVGDAALDGVALEASVETTEETVPPVAEVITADKLTDEADVENRQVNETIAEATAGTDAKLGRVDQLLTTGVANVAAISKTLQLVYQEVNNAGYRNLSPQETYRELEAIANTVRTVMQHIDTNFSGISTATSPLNQLTHDLANVKQELDQKVAEQDDVRDQAEGKGAVETDAETNPKVAKFTELQASLAVANDKAHVVLTQAGTYNQTVGSILGAISNMANSLSQGGAPTAGIFSQLNQVVSSAITRTGESSALQQEALAAVAAAKAAYTELIAA